MSSENNENKDFEKIFTEMVNSDELKDISENFEAKVRINAKELLLIQQSLTDVISNISEIMMGQLMGEDFIFDNDSIYHNLLTSIYKISEDFNECMVEYYAEAFEDDEDFEVEDEEDEEEGE
jgi:hypothetical protein